MTRVEDIAKAVEGLPADEYRHFRAWFLDRDWAQWDRQIDADSASGRLDFLVAEAIEEKKQGALREL